MKICSYCSREYKSSETLTKHLRKAHNHYTTVICCVLTRAPLTLEQFERRKYATCMNKSCATLFVKSKDRSKYCSQSCGATVNNTGRVHSEHSKLIRSRKAIEHGSVNILSCTHCGTEFRGRDGKFCSPNCWNKANPDRKKQYRANSKAKSPTCEFSGQRGGYRPRAGRGHHGWYGGIWCDSTYEMAYVWYCQTNGKTITRNKEAFSYINCNGDRRNYIPDFIVDGGFVEVKGWLRKDDPFKLDQFPHEIRLLTGDEILQIVKLAKEELGVKDLSKLFSERPLEYRTCKYCGEQFSLHEHNRKNTFCNNTCSAKHRHLSR